MANTSKKQKRVVAIMKGYSRALQSILFRPIDNPVAWQEYKDRLKEVDAIIKRLELSWASYAATEIPVQFREGLRKTSKILGGSVEYRGKYIPKAVQTLQDQITLDMFTNVRQGRSDIHRLFRLTQQDAVSELKITRTLLKGAAEGTPKALKNELRKTLEKRLGSGQFVTVRNATTGKVRRYTLESYSELVSRTRIREAQSLGTIHQMSELGHDLVQVSDHGTEDDICLEFEGNVYSLSGQSSEFSQLTQYPPYHPNCKHVLSPFVASPADSKRGRAQRERLAENMARKEAALKQNEVERARRLRERADRAEAAL